MPRGLIKEKESTQGLGEICQRRIKGKMARGPHLLDIAIAESQVQLNL
jgi:hypothetical protein